MAKAKKLKLPKPKKHDKLGMRIDSELNFEKLLKLPVHTPSPKKKA